MFARMKSPGPSQTVLRAMVDAMPLAVMTCDPHTLVVDYVNRSTVESLKKIEHLLPCRADDILGQCIDIFHKHPEHQRRLLADPANLPHHAEIRLGDEILDLYVSPLHDRGRYVNAMLTWSIVTGQRRAEEQSGRLMQMLDDMPINVMLVDKQSLVITYVNKTSIETLRPLQQYLPCKVDELQGQCIDIFHKNPAHQRRLLADPANLPHQTKIRLGPETLDLRVSAIRDANGDYVAPMLNWMLATQREKLADDFEANVAGLVGQLLQRGGLMQENALSLVASAEETNSQSTTVAGAAEQLSASINEITAQVASSTRVAREAVEAAERSSGLIGQMADAAQKIGDVVTIIQTIADQTNLLALNATIEAARAGDAGKGFAVVASEVKQLAGETTRATGEISSSIHQIQASTSESVEAIGAIQAIIDNMAQISSAVAAAVEEQAAATQQVAVNIDAVREASLKSGALSSEVQGTTERVVAETNTLKGQVDEFLKVVRAM